MGPGFSPLDEELGLLPGGLTPRLHEQLVRLGTWIPSFEKATRLLKDFSDGSVISEATARRNTENAGAAYASFQEQEVERLERELPPAPDGPDMLLLSTDGAMVPLVGGEWAEVKTLVIGEMEQRVQSNGETEAHAYNLSYFSRMIDSDTYQRLALVETHQRGVETAGQVGAVADGAEWIQKFVDFHRPDAVRILDFPHAAERINLIGQAEFGEGTPAAQTWLGGQLHQLKHEGPASVLAELRRIVQVHSEQLDLQEHLNYLAKREAHMQYPVFRVAGWPIGSGTVESGNKLVIEARLKGSGMRWAPSHVNSMAALRNIVCSDRWEEAWPQITLTLRQQDKQRRAQRRKKRRAGCTATPSPTQVATTPAPNQDSSKIVSPSPASVTATSIEVSPVPAAPGGPRRPAPDHPWRRSPIGKARYQSRRTEKATKT